MFETVQDLLTKFVVDLLPGDALLNLVDQYFTYQSDGEKVLMLVGMFALAGIGLISVVKSILKLASGVLKLVIFAALAYYIFVVVLGVDLWGMIF